MSAIALKAAAVRAILVLGAMSGPGAALAQSFFDPHLAPVRIEFRPGSVDELLFVTNHDVGAKLVLARYREDGRFVITAEILGPFNAAAFLDRDRILTGDKRGAVTIWSLAGKKLQTFIAAGPPIAYLGVSLTGRLVAMRHPRGPIRVFSATGQLRGTLGLGPTGIECEDEFGTGKIVFTPDERLFASTDNCGKLIVATIAGRPIPIEDRNQIFVSGLALSRDGRTLLLSYFGMPGGGADFRTIAADRVSARREVPGPFGHADPQAVTTLGDRFVVASRNRLRFLADDGRQLAEDVAIDRPRRLAAADNGERLAVYAQEGVVMFDSAGKRLVPRPFADFGAPTDAALLPGDITVSLSGYGLLRFWKTDGTAPRNAVVTWPHGDVEYADARPGLLVSPSRKLLAAVTPLNTVQLFDNNGERRGAPLPLGLPQYRHAEPQKIALLDDRIVVPAPDEKSLRVLSFEGKMLAENLAPHRIGITAIAFAGDGSRFVTLGFGASLRLWSSDGALIKEQRTINQISHGTLVFAPQGGVVALVARTKMMLWHFEGTGRIEQRPGRFVRFLPDGALVRVEGNELIIDELDGSERFGKSFHEPTVHAVSDDARWAILSERGVTRHVSLRETP